MGLRSRDNTPAADLTLPSQGSARAKAFAMPALAQTRPGAKGGQLLHACVPVSEFGEAWPPGVPVQVHGMDADPFVVEEGDIDAARALVATTPDAELFLYPGKQHLFTDSSLPSYDEQATALLIQRVLDFLAKVR